MDAFDVAPYTSLAFHLNGLIDAGERLDLASTEAHVADGTLFTWLAAAFPNKGVRPSSHDEPEMLERFQSIAAAYGPSKFLVASDGLSLLLAWCIESVQQVLTRPHTGPVDREFVLERIERAFAGWETEMSKSYRSEPERVWYGRLDEAVATGLQAGLLSDADESMISDRVALLDPSCDPDTPLGRMASE